MSDRDQERQIVQSAEHEGWMTTEGTEECSGAEFDWSFSMDTRNIVARLVEEHGYCEPDAAEELRLWLDDHLSERVFLLISEFWAAQEETDPVDAGHIRDSQVSDAPAVIPRADVRAFVAVLRAKLKQQQMSLAQGDELRVSEATSSPKQATDAPKAIRWQASLSGNAHEPSVASLLSGSSIDPEKWEFFLSDGSGDEWFEVIDGCEGSSRQEGNIVVVNRGDKLKICFNAISISKREAPGFVYEADAEISAEGELVLINGLREVFGCFPAAEPARMILLDQRNGNFVRFCRTDGRLDTLPTDHERN